MALVPSYIEQNLNAILTHAFHRALIIVVVPMFQSVLPHLPSRRPSRTPKGAFSLLASAVSGGSEAHNQRGQMIESSSRASDDRAEGSSVRRWAIGDKSALRRHESEAALRVKAHFKDFC